MKTSITQQASGVRYCCALLVLLISSLSARAQNTWGAEYVAKLQGMMGVYEGELNGKYPIRLILRPGGTDSSVVGTYYYLSKGKPLELLGHIQPSLSSPSLELRELASTGTVPTGWFSIGLSHEPELLGHWYNKSGTTLLPLKLRRVNGAAKPAVASARVTSKAYQKYYNVPIATVPSAAVTAMLGHWFSLQRLLGETPAELQERMNDQKATESHYGAQELQYFEEYNAHGLLSISYSVEGVGASVWHSFGAQTVDLATGFPLHLPDELQPDKLLQFYALGQQKLEASVALVLAGYRYEEGGALLAAEDVQNLRSLHFDKTSLQEFTLVAGGLVVDYPVSYAGLSNFIFKELQGSLTLTFTRAELKPFLKYDSPLRRIY